MRYYRAIELWVARRLKREYKIDNDAVKESDVPSPLREEFVQRKKHPDPTWALGLRDSAELLAALGDAQGRVLLEHLKEKRIDVKSRNKNWLIHGQQHVDQSAARAFRTSVLEALGIESSDVKPWPDFRADS